MRLTARIISTVGLFFLALGLGVLPLQAPAFTSVLVERFSSAEQTGLTTAEVRELAEKVRAFVVTGRGELPETYAGVNAFEPEAVGHLADVQDVLAGAQRATVALALAALLAAVAAWRGGRRPDIVGALAYGGAVTVGLVVGAGLFALTDFDSFFSAFHKVFFAEGTWTFPYDSMLIRLFPVEFWVAAGVGWGVLVFAVGCAYLSAAAFLRGRWAREPEEVNAAAAPQKA